MADIRIKDLATTASSAASDDFMALDGATNGTRKMSAANPSITTLTTSGVIAPGGSVHGANGSAANPSFAFLSNQNTGLYRIGVDNIGVATGGVKALDISSTGVVATTTLADQGGTIAAQRNGLAPRQGLVFDGTAGVTASNMAVIGTGDFSILAWMTPTNLVAANISDTASGQRFSVSVDADGPYVYNGSVVRPATVPIVAGLPMLAGLMRQSGQLYSVVNGVRYGPVSDSTNYSAAIGQFGAYQGNSAFFVGTMSPVVYNRALSAAEVLALYQSGAPAGADYNTTPASNTNIQTATFAAHLGGSISSASASGFTATAASGYALGSTFAVRAGNQYRVSVTCASLTGTSQIWLWDVAGVTDASARATLATGTFVFTATRNAASVGLLIGNGVGTWSGVVSAVTEFPLGLLLAPDSAQAGGGLAWYDTSGNAANITLPATGVSWSLPTSGKAFSLSLASSTAGSAGAGALVVTGGLSAGNNGNASFFGGNASISGPAKATLLIDSADAATNGSALAFASGGSYKWIIKGASFTDGSLFTIGTATGVFTSTPVLSLNYSTAAATFAGAVTVGGAVTLQNLLVEYNVANSPLTLSNPADAGAIKLTTGSTGGFVSSVQVIAGNATVNPGSIMLSPSQAGSVQLLVRSSAPTYVKGAIYFDSTLNKLRVGGATAWETITSV